jgi:hypothetical protein
MSAVKKSFNPQMVNANTNPDYAQNMQKMLLSLMANGMYSRPEYGSPATTVAPNIFEQLYTGDMAKSFMSPVQQPGSLFDDMDTPQVAGDPRTAYRDSDYGMALAKYIIDAIAPDIQRLLAQSRGAMGTPPPAASAGAATPVIGGGGTASAAAPPTSPPPASQPPGNGGLGVIDNGSVPQPTYKYTENPEVVRSRSPNEHPQGGGDIVSDYVIHKGKAYQLQETIPEVGGTIQQYYVNENGVKIDVKTGQPLTESKSAPPPTVEEQQPTAPPPAQPPAPQAEFNVASTTPSLPPSTAMPMFQMPSSDLASGALPPVPEISPIVSGSRFEHSRNNPYMSPRGIRNFVLEEF